MKDNTPNFAAWSHSNLAQFAEESYIRMQQQQDAIEQYQRDFKDAMVELRKLTGAGLDRGHSGAPSLTKGSPSR